MNRQLLEYLEIQNIKPDTFPHGARQSRQVDLNFDWQFIYKTISLSCALVLLYFMRMLYKPK